MRQVVNVYDIMEFFDKKERQSYKMMADIKKSYSKLAFQPITIIEFAAYYKITPESIIEVMKANDQYKQQQLEAKKQKYEQKEATKKKEAEVKQQQQLKRLEIKENQPIRFTNKTN